ncbi:DUF1819 family protein [Roseburia rectibacter]|jgi:hypothetical protein|uniref:DUF1819 family protein n=1 Tax=Roseburia rectibacter TaxID=2763062 RepID=UPI00164B7D0A|nr:DUF1819 family protein [Roseburia rectibacter]UMZ01547.1 DUF1819 family protein [Roseburia rectibacter]
MNRREYSAGAVKFSFWFMEFKAVVKLLSEGMTLDEVKEKNQKENIFGAPTTLRAGQIFSTVSARVKALDVSFYSIFMDSDLATQKLFALAGAMAHDTLFFDFVYEVVREKMIIGSNELSDSDINIFFRNKQLQDEKVAKWTDATLNRLGRTYKTMLFEAGMTDKGTPRTILKPILDPAMEHWLLDNGMEPIVKALTGVR